MRWARRRRLLIGGVVAQRLLGGRGGRAAGWRGHCPEPRRESDRPCEPGRPRERGSSTVVAVGAVGVLALVSSGALVLGSAVAAMHRARSASDLGALSAAAALSSGVPDRDACAAGALVVRANRAAPLSCRTAADGSVTVVAAARPALPWPGLDTTARATARAGPAP
jgi:secretion/DNA translocation related TadE-like protein